jgi:hypothetical protein
MTHDRRSQFANIRVAASRADVLQPLRLLRRWLVSADAQGTTLLLQEQCPSRRAQKLERDQPANSRVDRMPSEIVRSTSHAASVSA